jgi:PAS domain S-box-containing protein
MAEADGLAAALRLAAIVESSDDAIVSKDLTGRITSWNRSAERMFGYTAEEVIGQSIAIIIPEERRSEETEVLRRICAGESVDHFETIRSRKDGTILPVSLTISPIRAPDGTVVGASKIARDITDRKRAEAIVADLQRRLLTLVSASSALLGSPQLEDVLAAAVKLAADLLSADAYAVWRLDATTKSWKIVTSAGISSEFAARLVAADQAMADTSLSREPLIVDDVHATSLLEHRREAYSREGIQSFLVVPMTIGSAVSATLVAYFRSRHHFSDVEVQTARALGNLAAAAVTTAELYDAERRSREALERASSRSAFLADVSAVLAGSLDYEVMLKAVANLVVPAFADWCAVDIVDERAAVERVTVARAEAVSTDPQRVAQTRYAEDPTWPPTGHLVIKTGRSVLVKDVQADMQAEVRDEERLRMVREIALTSYISVPMLAHGRTLGALSFLSGGSNRHYTEEDLRFAEDIAYRAALAVDNADAYRQASAANRAKDEFLATLSHELRTPLNAVLGWARILRDGGLREDRRGHALSVIERNAEAQLHLVEDLLDVSRIITGKFRLDVQEVDLSTTIEAAIEAIQPAASAKDIRLQRVLGPNAGPVYGDAARLQQVAWNLLANAVKFTPRGGRVQITLLRTNSHAELEVTDTGEGLAADVLPFVFDRFRQGDSGPARGHMGLGLGLAIVRHIVELHGGSVAATSAGKGQGATFKIKLPVIAAERVRGASRIHPSVSDGAIPVERRQMLGGVHVLVVEDDPDTRELITNLLSDRDARVTAVESAAAGLAFLDQMLPDVILSDIEMPNQDGYEFIQTVRRRAPDKGGSVAAIALTAYARPQDRARSLLSGFQVHLSKPVNFNELLAAVASLGGKSPTTFSGPPFLA